MAGIRNDYILQELFINKDLLDNLSKPRTNGRDQKESWGDFKNMLEPLMYLFTYTSVTWPRCIWNCAGGSQVRHRPTLSLKMGVGQVTGCKGAAGAFGVMDTCCIMVVVTVT